MTPGRPQPLPISDDSEGHRTNIGGVEVSVRRADFKGREYVDPQRAWKRHSLSAVLGAVLGAGSAVVAVLFFFASVRTDAAEAKAATTEHEKRIQAVENNSGLLRQSIEMQGKAIDAMQGDVKELLRRVPQK